MHSAHDSLAFKSCTAEKIKGRPLKPLWYCLTVLTTAHLLEGLYFSNGFFVHHTANFSSKLIQSPFLICHNMISIYFCLCSNSLRYYCLSLIFIRPLELSGCFSTNSCLWRRWWIRIYLSCFFQIFLYNDD